MGELRTERQQDRDALRSCYQGAQRLPVPLPRDGRKRKDDGVECSDAEGAVVFRYEVFLTEET